MFFFGYHHLIALCFFRIQLCLYDFVRYCLISYRFGV